MKNEGKIWRRSAKRLEGKIREKERKKRKKRKGVEK
jgi:hypothetical protein